MNTGYSTAEAQKAFLNLPPDDQKTLELQHWIIADAMNIIYNEHHTSKDAEDAELLVGVNPILLRSIDDLKLSHRSNNVLWNNNTYLIGELVQLTDKELLRLSNFGKVSLKEIQDALEKRGLSLGMKIDNFEAARKVYYKAS